MPAVVPGLRGCVMKLAVPLCPECGELASSYDENVLASAELTYDEDAGEFEVGESNVSAWDSTEPVVNEKGELTLNCRSGHSWQSAELPEDAVQVMPEVWSDKDCDAADEEGWNVFNPETDPIIEADSDAEEFEDNDAALRFVRARAKRGSELHQKALRVCGLKRFETYLTLKNGKRFVRQFDDLNEAKRLCGRVAEADANSADRCGHSQRFESFAIDDTHDGTTYLVADWDDYFGIHWSEPTTTVRP